MKSFLCLIGLSISSLFFTTHSLQAQSVATINGEPIEQAEFLYAFNKNRKETEPIILDSLEAYLEQYINFKLKVREARALGLDSSQAFQEELQGYISQIRKPYLENPQAEEELLKETYRHMQTDVNASHILIKLPATALPTDTLKAYNFLDSLKQTIGSREEFEEIAKKFSQDGSAQTGGNLGWFTALHMVAPFEDGAYETPVGKVSEIVRSSFGYHLIYVNDKRENRGKVLTSHIFFTKQRGKEALEMAQMVYDSLQNGGDWEMLARKYSDDSGTKTDGGRLPWAGVKQLPDEFLEIAYSIEERGEYTEPKETQYGWHIIKLNDVQPLEPYEIKKGEIAMLLKRMGRNTLEEDKLMSKLKKENSFSQSLENLDDVLNQLSLTTKSDASESELAARMLFQHGENSVHVKDFLEAIPSFKIQYSKSQLANFYKKFEKDYIIAYEDSIAPAKYPEYRLLINEYEEGLLLFEIMEEKVWRKSVLDSVGLQRFYQSNIKDYHIGERLDCLCINSPSAEVKQQLSAIIIPPDSLNMAAEYIAKQLDETKSPELKIAKRTLLASDFSNFEAVKNAAGQWFEPNSLDAYCLIQNTLPEGPQPLNEIKGIVMSDYQEELDEQWVKDLRSSVKIKVDKKALKAIANN